MCVQYRIEVGFGDPQPAFGAVGRARIRRAVGGVIEAGDQAAVHTRHEQVVAWIISRITRFETHAVGDAPAAQMLAGARVGKIRRRELDAASGLLDHQAADAVISQLDRRR